MKQGADLVSEPLGFKVLIGGTASWIASALASLDWAQVAGIMVAIVGAILQYAAYRRNQAADKRERERHRLEVAVLRKQLGDDYKPDFEVSET